MTLRSRKNHRTTARSAPAATAGKLTTASAAVAADVGRRTTLKVVVVLACGAVLAPLILFAATARGAELRSSGFRSTSNSGASLRWRPASDMRQTETPASGTPIEAPAVPSPELLDADVDARPLDVEAAAARIFRDEAVTPAQAKAPVDDPFGDEKQPSSTPRLLTQPTPDPAISQPSPTPALPQLPSSSDQIAQGTGVFQEMPCPKISDLKAIGAITNNIAAAQGELPRECYFDESVATPENRAWAMTTYTWKASGMCHKPLYFEEVALERYGHSTGPFSQPLVSGAHFFGSLVVLPYKMGIDPPGECKYALGYYRPGSCAPYIIPGVPITGRAVANQAAFVSGLIWLWP